jgi:predicted SprT family Zn-dependent metalloprotease
MREHGFGHLDFEFSRSKSTLGRCHFLGGKPVKIDLSEVWLPSLDDAQVRDTILHEIAHAIAGADANHGPRWQRVALSIGAKPFTTGKIQHETFMDVKRAVSKYQATCNGCGGNHLFDRMTKNWQQNRYVCKKCRGSFTIKTLY